MHVSTCAVLGNKSNGIYFSTVYPHSTRSRQSLAAVAGLHETITILSGNKSHIDVITSISQPFLGGSTIIISGEIPCCFNFFTAPLQSSQINNALFILLIFAFILASSIA